MEVLSKENVLIIKDPLTLTQLTRKMSFGPINTAQNTSHFQVIYFRRITKLRFILNSGVRLF